MALSLLTATPLAANAEYSNITDRIRYINSIAVKGFIFADQNAVVHYEESDDRNSWTELSQFNLIAGTLLKIPWIYFNKRYFRFRIANGGLAQSTFTFYQFVGEDADVNLTINTAVKIAEYGHLDVSFQDAAIVSGNGAPVSVEGFKTLVLEIYGTNSPTGSVNFEAAGPSGLYTPVSGTKLNGLTSGITTASIPSGAPAQPELWRFDVSALDMFLCPITRTAGNITVKGRLSA